MPRIRPLAPNTRALPTNVTSLEAQRIVARKVSMVDEAEQVLLALFEDEDFRRLRAAIEPEDAVEGNLFIDDVMAAEMFRKKSIGMRMPLLSVAKLDKVSSALKRAESRFNANRKQRARAPQTAAAE